MDGNRKFVYGTFSPRAWGGARARQDHRLDVPLMIHIYTITKADVGDGVYRHPFGSKMRFLLVSIKDKFGGIGPRDVGKKIYRASNGQLAWEGSFGRNNPRHKKRKARRNARYWSGYSKKDLSLYYKDLLPDERRSQLAAARESLRWANTSAERKKVERHMKRLRLARNPKRHSRKHGKRRR